MRNVSRHSMVRAWFVLGLSWVIATPPTQAAQDEISAKIPSATAGETLYAKHCAGCHTGGEKTAGPHLSALRRMSAGQLRFALVRGKMRTQAEPLGRAGREAVLSFLSVTGDDSEYEVAAQARCSKTPIASTPNRPTGAWAAWGLDAQNTRRQTDTKITAANVGELELAWSFGLPNTTEARSQPVVTADHLYVAATSGHVFALDRESGCVRWHFRSDTLLRSALTLGEVRGRPALFIGSFDAQLLAIGANTGELLWQKKLALFDASTITGASVQHDKTLYVPISAFGVALAQDPRFECCKSHGAVRALNADTGAVLWTTRMAEPAAPTYKNSVGTQMWGPSGAPIWSAPTLDIKRQRLYVGTGENTSSPATGLSDSIVALDMHDGRILWSYQGTQNDAFNMACGYQAGPSCPKEDGPDFDFGAPPILVSQAKGPDLLIAGQKSGEVHALNAATGKVVWRKRLGQGSALGGVHWGMALADQQVIVPIADPPFPRPGYTPQPGVYSLELATGELRWQFAAKHACEPDIRKWSQRAEPWPACSHIVGFSAAPSTTPELAFAASLDGSAQAFRLSDGEPLWRTDTVREYATVNGVSAHGGSIDNAGVQVADDMLFMQSGYSLFSQMPGNVLLAFRLPGPAPAEPGKAVVN